MAKTRWRSAVALVAALTLAGCGAAKIAYTPMPAAPPASAAAVALKVVDERPADKGGSDKAVVGQVRGSYAIPSSVKDSNPNVVVQTVTDATSDALRQSGVTVQAGANRTLVATVQHYWMDGFAGYKATVKVKYTLEDASGKVLWTKEVTGGAGGALVFKSADSMTTDVFGNALTDLAKKAQAEFETPDFKKAVA